MSDDDEDEKQPRKSVRDRILLFQNTASRNNSNKSSPNEVRKVQIEVTDKNGNKQDNMSPEKTNLKINKSVKDSANGNSSYKTNLNQGESSQTSSKEQERNAQNKRTSNKWSFMPKTDSCIVCSKAVYMNEMSRSEGKVFHKACQKCTECTRTLPIGDVLLVGNKLYCRQHGSQEKMKLLKMRSEVD
ncbi:LIM domain-containing protein PLIM2c-like [Anneissia japonica]|uniref:LIM domain-containing protein PLIM2c-like n=1 Tax=Anneissia japonica TaxID=1529436 RepID=UPI0014254F15|nr:LIM domain-containing protein PLIM2c-like [Anneissia japonica]